MQYQLSRLAYLDPLCWVALAWLTLSPAAPGANTWAQRHVARYVRDAGAD